MNSNFFEIMEKDAALVNAALKELHPPCGNEYIEPLLESERYSLMAGGKRIRPIIALAFCRLFGGEDGDVMPYACALEMVHTSSLIHDDLPCMDNDTVRRGKPTNHTVYGEAVALLAGDALLTDAFGVVAGNKKISPELSIQAVSVLADAAVHSGIAGGQYLDKRGETDVLDLSALKTVYDHKTGALIRASAVMGALAAGIHPEDPKMKDVIEYARCIGLTFQIVDDILDVTGTVEHLGKDPGRDKKDNKTTYLSFFSVNEAYEHAAELTENAIRAIAKYENNSFLVALAEYLLKRKN